MEIDLKHPLAKLLEGKKIVLGSQSPRRQELLSKLGLPFETRPSHAPEDHDALTPAEQLPLILATRKADWLKQTMAANELLITADTIVIKEGQVIEKPRDLNQARLFLEQLAGDWHSVITGYCIVSKENQYKASVKSRILFNTLQSEEIDYYLSHFNVLDKAGAYGIQDWIGLIGVSEIQGSYHNVMGLPTAHLYHQLKIFLSK